jgi:hypothetical protein
MAGLLTRRHLFGMLLFFPLTGCLQSSIEELVAEQANASQAVPQGILGDLSEQSLEALMTEVLLRFRSYEELRERLPLELLLSPGADCRDDISFDTVNGVHFLLDLSCEFAPALNGAVWEGSVEVAYEFVSVMDAGSSPSELDILMTYWDVRLGDEFSVDGVETLFDDTSSASTTIGLDVVQTGLDLAYEFQIEQISVDQVLISYDVQTPSGPFGVILSNPGSLGAFASATVMGIDGSLQCEIRNAAWEPGQPAKGTCEDGSVFGL